LKTGITEGTTRPLLELFLKSSRGVFLRGACSLAQEDRNLYPAGAKVAADEFAKVNLRSARFHGGWNYTLIPISRAKK